MSKVLILQLSYYLSCKNILDKTLLMHMYLIRPHRDENLK